MAGAFNRIIVKTFYDGELGVRFWLLENGDVYSGKGDNLDNATLCGRMICPLHYWQGHVCWCADIEALRCKYG